MTQSRHVDIVTQLGGRFTADVSYAESSWCWRAKVFDAFGGGLAKGVEQDHLLGTTPFEAIARAISALMQATDKTSDYSPRERTAKIQVRDDSFAVSSSYGQAPWGWVGNLGLFGENDRTWRPWAESRESKRAFTNPYDCIGNAVAFAAATAEGLDYDPFPEDAAETRAGARRLFSWSDLYTLDTRE